MDKAFCLLGEVTDFPVAGNPADPGGPVALRPRLAAGLPLLRYKVSGLQDSYRLRAGSTLEKSISNLYVITAKKQRGPAYTEAPELFVCACYLMSSKILNIGM